MSSGSARRLTGMLPDDLAATARGIIESGPHLTRADVEGPAPRRLYRAVAAELFLGVRDLRRPVVLA
jgi:hypothetical protein